MYVSMYVCCEQTRFREPTSIDKMKSTYDGDDSGKMTATCIDRNTGMKPTPVTQAATQAVIQAGCTLVERRMIMYCTVMLCMPLICMDLFCMSLRCILCVASVFFAYAKCYLKHWVFCFCSAFNTVCRWKGLALHHRAKRGWDLFPWRLFFCIYLGTFQGSRLLQVLAATLRPGSAAPVLQSLLCD